MCFVTFVTKYQTVMNLKYICFLIVFSFCFLSHFSCKRYSCTEDNERQKTIDSLESLCDTLLFYFKGPELREASRHLQKACEPESEKYFLAKAYYFGSYFNEKKYDKCISLIDEEMKKPYLDSYPAARVQFLYTRARCFQYKREYETAISSYRDILDYSSQDTAQIRQLSSHYNHVLQQLMNCYILTYRYSEGAGCFEELISSGNPLLVRLRARQLYISRAYLLSLSTDHRAAREVLEKGLKIPPDNDLVRLFYDYVYAGLVYHPFPEYRELSIKYWEEALKTAKLSKDPRQIQWAMTSLGDEYKFAGKFVEALKLYQDAIDMHDKEEDYLGLGYVYSSLSMLYSYWQFYDQAEKYFQEALRCARLSKSMDQEALIWYNLFLMTYERDPSDERVLSYLHSSDSCAALANRPDKQADVYLMTCGVYLDLPDSLDRGAEMLERLYRETQTRDGEIRDMRLEYYYGKALFKKGAYSESLPYLRRALKMSETEKNLLEQKNIYGLLIECYSRLGDGKRVIDCLPVYQKLQDSIFNEKKTKQLMAAEIKYDVKRKEQENRLLEAEINLKNRNIQFYTAIVIILFLLISLLCFWLLAKIRAHRLQAKLLSVKEEQLKDMLSTVRELNERAGTADGAVGRILDNFQYSLFTDEQETRFRKAFSEVYPRYLFRLRKRYGEISKNEELLCMLLVMNLSTADIASTLGISAEGVKKARYRLRKKMRLATDDSLEDAVKSFV